MPSPEKMYILCLGLMIQLDGKRVFTTLGARTGYWQICMHEASREKAAFATMTMNGLYEFRVMPFGLCSSPATFQRLMQKTLQQFRAPVNVKGV